MKRTATKSLRAGLAFVLVICMMFSLCGAAFAAEAKSASEVEDEVLDILDEIFGILKDYGPSLAGDSIWEYVENDSNYDEELIETYGDLRALVEAEIDAFYSEVSPEIKGYYSSLKEELKALMDELTADDSELKSVLVKDFDDLRKELQEKYDGIDDPQIRADAKAHLEKLESIVNEYKAKVAAYDERIAELAAEIASINEKLENVNNVLVNVEDEVKALKDEFDASEDDYEQFASDAVDYAYEVYNAMKDAKQLYTDIQDSSKEASSLLRDIAEEIRGLKDDANAYFDEHVADNEVIRDALIPVLELIADDVKNLSDRDSVKEADGTKAKIEAFQAEFDAQVEEILDTAAKASEAANQAYEDEKTQIRAELAELYHQLLDADKLPQEIIDAHDKAVANETDLQTRLSNLRADIKEATGDARELLTAEYKELEEQFNETKDVVFELNDQIRQAQENAKVTKDAIQAQIDKLEAREAVLDGYIEETYNKYIGEANDRVKALASDLNNTIDQAIADSKEDYDAAVAAGAKASGLYDQAIQDVITALKETKISEADKTFDALAQEIDDTVNAMIECAKEIKEAAVRVYNRAKETYQALKKIVLDRYPAVATGEYEIKATNYYVAIGDQSAFGEYPDDLAHLLALWNRYGDLQNVNLAKSDMLASDLYDIVVNGTDADFIAEIEKADIITVSFNPFTYGVLNGQPGKTQSFDPLSVDWTKYQLSSNRAGYLKAAIQTLYTAIASRYGDSNALQATRLVTRFIEGFVDFATYYAKSVTAIHELNPDARLIVVGNYNSFGDYTLTYGEGNLPKGGTTVIDKVVDLIDEADYAPNEIPVGWFFEQLQDLMDAYYITYATGSDDTMFVRVRKAESQTLSDINNTNKYDLGNIKGQDKSEIISSLGKMFTNIELDPITLTATGDTYVAQHIHDALDIYINVLKGDVNADGIVNLHDLALLRKYLATKDPDSSIVINKWNTDLDDDGEITIKDLGLLRRAFAISGGITVTATLNDVTQEFHVFYGNDKGDKFVLNNAVPSEYGN